MADVLYGFDSMLPKLCGADVELGAFRPGSGSVHERERTAEEVARAVLREIDGLPGDRSGTHSSVLRPTWLLPCGVSISGTGMASSLSDSDPQDWGRKFLPANGGCAYIDLGHLELCQPEVLSAFDHVASWHAMLRIARRALEAANRRVSDERRATVLVNNSDGHGNSYGSHLSFLVTRRTWDNLFCHKLHQLLYLASYQASAIVFTGAGQGREREWRAARRLSAFATRRFHREPHRRSDDVSAAAGEQPGRSAVRGGRGAAPRDLLRQHALPRVQPAQGGRHAARARR